FSSRRRHTRFSRDWSSDVCSSDLRRVLASDGKVKTELPEGFEPYPWQAVAATRIAELGRVMLCDDPGTGKTFSALMGLLERQHRSEEGRGGKGDETGASGDDFGIR